MYDEMVAEARAEEAASAFEEAEAAKLKQNWRVPSGRWRRARLRSWWRWKRRKPRLLLRVRRLRRHGHRRRHARRGGNPLVKCQFGRSGKGVGAIGCAARPIAAYRYARQ